MRGKDDRTVSGPLQTLGLTPGTLKIRGDISLPQCAIDGCDEPPTERLPENMGVRGLIWCKPHADLIASEIAMRNYRDFAEGMCQQGIKGEPIAQRFGPAEDRRCSIPRCKREIATGNDLFSPYKSPGMVWVCTLHSEIFQQVVRNQNGRRVIHELWTPKKRKLDPERRKLEKAIRSAFAECRGRPRYIECVCKSLQKAPINMPARWLDRWENKFHLRFEPYDWVNAYQEKRIRGTIQRHISKVCRAKLRMPLK